MEEIQSIEQAIKLVDETSYNESAYQRITIQGMFAHIKNNMPSSSTYQDSLEIINQLSLAKYKLDCGCNQLLPVARATTKVLLSVQEFFDEEVIPCTEWPTPTELLEIINNHVRSA